LQNTVIVAWLGPTNDIGNLLRCDGAEAAQGNADEAAEEDAAA
jgi:hypothetical protein